MPNHPHTSSTPGNRRESDEADDAPPPFRVHADRNVTNRTGAAASQNQAGGNKPQVVEAIRINLLGPSAGDFADVTLTTTDNVKIPACRALLGIRSVYFKNLFFLPFMERSQRDIPVDLASSSLREILHYAYTDSTPLLDSVADAVAAAEAQRDRLEPFQPTSRSSGGATTLGKRRHPEMEDITPSVKKLVDLIRAADYVQMPALAKKALTAALHVTAELPQTVCTAYEAVHNLPTGMCVTLRKHVEKRIRYHPNVCLGVPDVRSRPVTVPSSAHGVRVLSEVPMESILSDSDMFTSETYLFETLFFWMSGALVSALRDVSASVLAEWQKCDRWPVAKRLMQHIDLERLKPSFLRDYVVPSTLVDKDRMYQTFMQQALEAERGRPLYDNFRGGSRWHNDSKRLRAVSGFARNYALTGTWVGSGRHEWSFKIIRNAACLWLGIASKEPPANAQMFFESKGGWAYSTSGRITPSAGTDFFRTMGPAGPAVFENGVVKLVLNLIKSGTLTIVVEGAPKSFPAFRELRAKATKFLPVVAISAPAEIELIGEKHHVA